MFNIDFEQLLLRLKLISTILSLIFGGLVAYFFIQFRKLITLKIQLAKTALHSVESVHVASKSKWEEIAQHIDSSSEAEWKLAVIEADKLVDSILKSAGHPGETMGDRMMSIEKNKLANLEGLWEAHKIRNKIVHDVNYFLRHAEARRAVQLYELVLRELGAI